MSANEKLLDVQHVTVEFHIGGLVGGTLLVAVNDISFSLESDRPRFSPWQVKAAAEKPRSPACFSTILSRPGVKYYLKAAM